MSGNNKMLKYGNSHCDDKTNKTGVRHSREREPENMKLEIRDKKKNKNRRISK